jgi:integrase
MNHTKFAVSRYENRNGVSSWRVTGWLHGVRIRKNLKSREEAAAEKAVLEIKALQAAAGLRAVATTLTEDQMREAESVFRRVGSERSLSFYVDFALANYHAPETQARLADAVAEYIAAKDHEFRQDQISGVQLARIRRDLKQLQQHFPKVSVAELTVSSLIKFFERGQPALKTYNNRRGIVSTFFKYAYQRGWVVENPIPKVPHHRIRRRRGIALTLTAIQARDFMAEMEKFEDGRWVPFFALGLFAGIRPSVPDGEIARLQPEDICLDTGIISISARVSKVREPRKVIIQPNLAAWLRAYPLDTFPIVVPDHYRRHAAITKKFGLSHDVLRHTFISMFVAKFRSMGEAALQAGNSESIIRKHYLDLKTTAEAEQFFGILPKQSARNATPTTVFPTPALQLAVAV